MRASMPAYRILGWGEPARLVEVVVPEPGPGQVRVRVAGCGLCHSDVAMGQMPAAIGEALGWSVPFTLGHETAGWVDAVGDGVASVVEGDPVAVASPASCGRCRWCLRGIENACAEGLVGRGYGRDGGLAQHVLVDEADRLLFPLGTLDPAVAGPLTDAGATSHHAVRRVLPRLQADGAAVVLGIGGLGAYVVQLLVALADVPVVAVDPNPARRALAGELGATHVVDGVGPDTFEGIRDALGGVPVDAVVDVVGIDDSIALGTRLLAPGGALALVGAAGGTLRRPWFSTLPQDGELFTFQGSDLADARAVLDLAAAGRIRVDVEPFGLDEVDAAYAAMEAGTLGGRAVVRP
ncbi:alcohol dehydrogenase catalytic domain-containing protein [Aquihabitans sp. G128]|uniref:alcohol dehydrogenase catalytic domain-containing protein n=1 Tax=Aquihabitans sp. G128 TaxID=2849779 RepID=UPI001C223F29|nr:alcohol dehydrogenase catalytic domain-containing protein [Aquihabitans sp. G128]QXC62757.1 alcohol dehydrogenase catalytic domain-containing protein [Aquihabitans sp. G128]